MTWEGSAISRGEDDARPACSPVAWRAYLRKLERAASDPGLEIIAPIKLR